MGLFLTLLYILTAYLAPTTIFGPLAEYRIELLLAALTLLVSVTRIAGSELFSGVQAFALPALVFSAALSIAGNGWLGGATGAMMSFIPNVVVFYFIGLNCTRPKHLKLLVVVLLCAATFIIGHACHDILVRDPFSPYLMQDSNGERETFYRIRGLALVSDPNDLAQFLVAMVPCAFFLWRRGSGFRNALLVYAPVLVLVLGLYLTHSRGGMLALLAMLLLAVRPKIGTVPAAIVAGIGFVAFTALGWSGGRDISVNSGSDRMDAWSTGLTLLRAHPLIGVGFGHFQEFYEITAHNTIIVCSAEIGLVGFFSWMMYVLPSVRDAIVGSRAPSLATAGDADLKNSGAGGVRAEQQSGGEDPGLFASSPPPLPPLSPHEEPDPWSSPWADQADRALWTAEPGEAPPSAPASGADEDVGAMQTDEEAVEIRRLCRLLLLSICGFLAAGWFLSRAFVLSLFLLGGMISTAYRMAVRNGAAPPLPFSRAAKLSALACAASLAGVYALLRVTSLVHH